MPYRNLYLSNDEYDFVRSHKEGYIRSLVQKEMGGGVLKPKKHSSDKFPKLEEDIKNLDECEKFIKRPPVPKIEGVSLGIPVRSDRPKCKVCGMNLNSVGQCSQKGCKKFMRVQ